MDGGRWGDNVRMMLCCVNVVVSVGRYGSGLGKRCVYDMHGNGNEGEGVRLRCWVGNSRG